MDLKKLLSNQNDYTELRYQTNNASYIVMSNGNIVNNVNNENRGFSARVLKGDGWGFSSTSRLDDNSVKKAINQANSNAAFLQIKRGSSDLLLPSNPIILERDLSTQRTILTVKDRIDILQELHNYISKTYTDLKSITLVLHSESVEKNVVTSDGSEFKTIIPRSFIRCMLMIENGSEMISEACILGGLGDFEDNIINLEEFYSEIATTYKHLINKKSAVFAEAGIQDVVLGADLAGILAHEAIGHTTEADLVRNGSIASRLMDQPIASEMVNLIDIPHTYDGKLCPRPVFVDDEGVEAKTVNVIENGILRNYMHNKESALHYGAEPMGNARASQFSDEPLIRMRNTMIVPGKDKVEDMIKSIKNGYYLLKPNNGQADSTSEFMFGVTRGYEIKDGKICKAIKETTISGIAVELLKTITAISDDLKWSGAGTCGKKQGIAVGMGGPAIKCKVTMGGK